MIHKAVGATALVAGILLVLCALGGMDCGTVGFARGMLQAWGGLILSAPVARSSTAEKRQADEAL